MPGDHTRFTFDPFDDHIAVRMQQGRVLLDADFNELVEIRDRRSRAGTLDTLGSGVVPDETPHGFEITVAGPSISIGVGRMYVDGQLAENHGLGPREWEQRLAEERGTLPVPYEQQPYFPNVAVEAPFPAPSPAGGGGPHLVYLDVWQRELTHLEDPELLEKALGVDTATRLQTVWQVKVLANVAASCDTPDGQIPAWEAATAPSAGRLTTSAVGVPSSNDPCIVNPTGGYRGTENRLYRVEVHRGGPLGTATFKWSRDNGSVASAVTGINLGRDRLTVSRTRRDAVLRFSANDWVEVTDDWRELAGKPGVMAKVQSVDDVNQTLTLSAPLPAGIFDLGAPGSRHTRVRRWDQKGLVLDALNNVVADVDAGLGEIPVNAAASMVLEDGLEVSFSVAAPGGSFKVGDFWVVAARTVDASVEILTQAPPRGIHHHYARLAMVTFPGTVEDCRDPWPPRFGRSCCTRVVFPGESIQAAIDSLPAAGGCVCLKVGVHTITEPIRITAHDIHFHGESTGAVVETNESIPLLNILGAEEIVVESLGFRALSKSPYLVGIDKSHRVVMADCELRSSTGVPAYAVLVESSGELRFERLTTFGTHVGLGAGNSCYGVEVLSSTFGAPFLQDGEAGFCGIWFQDVNGGPDAGISRIEGNRLFAFQRGIALNEDLTTAVPISSADNTVIAGNYILRGDPVDVEAERLWGIDVAADGCEVRDNLLYYAADNHGGIRMAGAEGRVSGNQLQASQRDDFRGVLPLAILVGNEELGNAAHGHHGQVVSNFITGTQDGIWVSGAAEVTLEDNELGSDQATLRLALALGNTFRANVDGNRIRRAQFGALVSNGFRCRFHGNRMREVTFGLVALAETDFEVAECGFEAVEHEGVLVVFGLGQTRIAGSRFYSCAYNSVPTTAAAVQVLSLAAGVFTEVKVDGCEIRDTGVSLDGKPVDHAATGIWIWALGASLTGNRVHYTDPTRLNPNLEHRAARLTGFLSLQVTDQFTIGFGSALVAHNKLFGPGRSALVEVLRLPINNNLSWQFARTVFSNNDCEHFALGRDDRFATVSLDAVKGAVVGNLVRATTDFFSFHLHSRPTTFQGNLHQGPVLSGGAVIPVNFNLFNILG